MGFPAAGTKNLKDHRKPSAGTARDYSTTFGVTCKDCRHNHSLSCYHTACAKERKIRECCGLSRKNLLRRNVRAELRRMMPKLTTKHVAPDAFVRGRPLGKQKTNVMSSQ